MLNLTFGTDVFGFVSGMCPVWLEAQPKLSDTRCTKWIAEQLRSCNHVKHLGRTCEKMVNSSWLRIIWEKGCFADVFLQSSRKIQHQRECKTLHRPCGYVQNLVPWWVQEQWSLELIDVELLRIKRCSHLIVSYCTRFDITNLKPPFTKARI